MSFSSEESFPKVLSDFNFPVPLYPKYSKYQLYAEHKIYL